MQTTITLNASKCALCDIAEPILMPENLTLHFESNVYNISNMTLVVTAKNGEKKKQYKAHSGNSFTIDISDMISMGAIDIEISACIKGNAVKEWRVPSFIVREIDHKFELIPEIEQLKGTLKLQAQAIYDLKNLIEKQGEI